MRKILFYSKCLSKLFKSLIFMMMIIFAPHAVSKEGLLKNEVSVQKQNQILTQKNAILESENDILKVKMIDFLRVKGIHGFYMERLQLSWVHF